MAERLEHMAEEEQRLQQVKIAQLQRRLSEQAMATRKQAGTTAYVLGQEDPLNVMKGAASEEAVALSKALSIAAKDPEFMVRATTMRESTRKSIAETVIDVQDAIADFVNASATQNQSQLVTSTGNLVMFLVRRVQQHQREGGNLSKAIQQMAPRSLRTTVVKAISRPIAVAGAKFMKMSSAVEACGNLAELASDLGGYVSNITKVRSTLNATAASLPMLDSITNDSSAQVMSLVQDAIDLGYMEIAAVEELSRSVVGTLAPVMLSKLHCTYDSTSAGPHAGLGVVAVVLAAVAALLGL